MIRTSAQPKDHFEGRWKKGKKYTLYAVVVNNGTKFRSVTPKEKDEPYVIYNSETETFSANAGWEIVEMSEDSRLSAMGGNGGGASGQDGKDAGFGTISASVANTSGNPSVVVETSGPDTAKNINFKFFGLKGLQGIPGISNADIKEVDVLPEASAQTTGRIYLVETETANIYARWYTEQDGNTYTWRSLGTTDISLEDYATKDEVSQLQQKVDNIATGKFYGYHPSAENLPEGDLPGYAYVGLESPYSIYNFDGTTWTDSGATVKRGEGQIIYLEDFPGYASDLSPVAMREFLQSAIDYVGEKRAMLVFPKGQTFVIDIPETDIDIRYDCEGGDGLQIPSDITIDFNYSTIKADTNHWWCYNIIHIPVTTEKATLMNGYIVGDRDTHIMSNTVSQNTRGTTDEWHCCIRVHGKGKDRLVNMVCSDVRGDGISIEGECQLNHPIAISDSALNKGQTVDDSGALSADANYITTNLLTIDTYYTSESHKAGLQTYLTPRTSIDRVANNVECSYQLTIAYYTDTDVFISSETIMMGDPMNIPQNASKFRITQWVADSSLSYGFWVMNTLWNDLSLIQGCEVTRCGRNGILPTVCNGLVIQQCKISKIFGTNNRVAIDIEGTSYVQHNIYISDCLIDNPGYNGIIIAQGERIFVNNCVLNGCGISSSGNRVHIAGCKADDITIRLPVSTIYETDLIYGKSTIRNCDVLNNINAAYSIVENCVCKVCSTEQYYRDKKIVAPIFRGCKLQKVGESYSLYEDCEILSEDTNAILLRSNEVDFSRCKIKVPRINIGENAKSKFEECEIVVIASGNDVIGIQTDYFVNNHIITEGPNAANKFNIKPVGNVCVIEKNTYEGQFFYNGLILTNGYLSVAKIIAVRDNCFVSTQNGAGTFLRINAALKESMVFFERNVMSSASNWTDIGITGVAESDILKIFTDSNIQIGGGTLAELADLHIYRATWTPSA